ncbi:hypothetical protein AX777_21340 [Sphingobium yanoikuyae]|jgi:hypothetical protein|uniref:AAA family ATPase n=1 Tax=Sphingobium yanoikuyae TaxID=13690 RepID=A0A177JKL1_SPHYA|nr:AAA family ATPase [Sphingobium yanoikuyae]OAH41859.1 hypothetical protein AX777_21340 [Sphingobium yanoikuyae]
MTIRFIPVHEITEPRTIALGLSGGSGTGKTFTALRVARGIAESMTGKKGAPIGYVDTENKRALHYKEAFPEMMHFDFTAINDDGELVGFGVDRWIEVIDAAEAAKLPVVILDSFSHAWEGIGGVLDEQAQALDRLVEQAQKRANGRYEIDPSKFGQLAWAEVKPKYRRLIDRIVRAKTNIIICTRAKPVMQKGFGDKAENARATKTRRKDVPWDPASDGDLMFEMTAMIILDPAAPGCPVHQIKVSDQFKNLFDPRRPMGEMTGAAMAEWAKGEGEAQRQKEMMDFAREKARAGSDAFKTWWATDDGKAARPMLRPIMDEIQQIAADADKAAAQSDDDPFANEGPADEQRGEAFNGADEDEIAKRVRDETNAMAAAA